MSTLYALDLKVARRKSGLMQSDCAHLLDTYRSRISELEHGKLDPTAYEIATLSLIYGRSYDGLCRSVFERAASDLFDRLNTITTPGNSWLCRFNRTNTLDTLQARLSTLNPTLHEAA